MTTNQHQEILRTEGLSKFFPGVKALDNVDFSLRRGEIMALLGENGAGKSTLIKALTGVYHADRGTIWLEGQAISPKNTAHAQQLGIGTVYQEVNLLPNMSVADNLFIGREPKRFGLLRRKEMEKRATELMASYGFSLDVREPLNRFSVAMQQIVAICRAIDLSAKVSFRRRCPNTWKAPIAPYFSSSRFSSRSFSIPERMSPSEASTIYPFCTWETSFILFFKNQSFRSFRSLITVFLLVLMYSEIQAAVTYFS